MPSGSVPFGGAHFSEFALEVGPGHLHAVLDKVVHVAVRRDLHVGMPDPWHVTHDAPKKKRRDE